MIDEQDTGVGLEDLTPEQAKERMVVQRALNRALDSADESQDDADYQDEPSGEERCDRCSMFVAPSYCTKVFPPIAPHGWCKRFEPRKAEDEAGGLSRNDVLEVGGGKQYGVTQ